MQNPILSHVPRIFLAAAIAVAVTAPPLSGHADPPRTADPPRSAGEPRDGQHDFDFLLGRWKVHLRRLKNPLHGSTEWYEGTGTSFARPLWNGKAQIEEFEGDTPQGHIDGLTLRLYSTTTRQWSLYWANQKIGHMDVPTIGEFKDGRGEFFDQEMHEGRSILVRYVWSNITPKSCHFEQSFSPDGGKTWEPNWITQLTRVE
ncbi:MAG TPA: hypothetical protein VK540_04060 [Polyangiaceae bacterium]|jgi:hypothetical protein|nr:hypothetical protein [Polyangiaceae bacterium]